MATSARSWISLSSFCRRAEVVACCILALQPTSNRKQIFCDHAPAHITLESGITFIGGSLHRERIFQMADGGLTAGAPAQGSLKPTFSLPLGALLRQAPACRQSHFVDSQSLRFPLVLGGEKSAVRGGHLRSSPKAIFVVLHGRQPRLRVRRVPFQNLVTAHDPVFHFVDSHQPTKLIRLMRFPLADHLCM